MSLPVLVINRDCDTDRWTATRNSANAHGIDPVRISAIDAHAPDFDARPYAEIIAPTFWGRDTIKPGAFGCFLSHRAAWTHIVDHGWPAALVLEDDADLIGMTDRVVQALSNCDLLFANDRMAEWANAVGVAGESAPLEPLIDALSEKGGPKSAGIRQAPGGDAYALTNSGAKRLLSITAQTRITCGVDWAMIWAALSRTAAFDGFEELGILEQTTPRPDRPIDACVLTDPVARLRKAPSVLKHSVEVPIAHLVGTAS